MSLQKTPVDPDFDREPTLSNERVLLRKVVLTDIPAILDISFYDGRQARTPAEAQRMLARIEVDRQKGESLHWGLCLPGKNDVIGTCGFYRGMADQVGEIGYILREPYRGQGLMTAAVELVLEYGFTTLDLKQIIAYTEPTNRRSIALLQRMSFSEVPSDNTYLKFALSRK